MVDSSRFRIVPWWLLLTLLDATVPWPETATVGNLWWGDYEDGVVGFGTRFHALWPDSRDGQTTSKLRGAPFNA